MGKLFLILSIPLFWYCHTNLDNKGISSNQAHNQVPVDTLIKEVKRVYRGDTLTTYLTIVGDTIIEARTSRYERNRDNEVITSGYMTRPRTKGLAVTEVYEESMSAAPMMAADGAEKGRVQPDVPANPQSGQVTAGEWNDLNKWDEWTALLNENEYHSIQDKWHIYPNERYSIFLTNEENIPLSDVRVALKSGNQTIWQARTDNGGKAELWVGIFGDQNIRKSNLSIEVEHNGSKYSWAARQGKTSHLEINTTCHNYDQVDVMFVVDATGSMGDEITYLKSEVKDVIQSVKENNNRANIRIGSVFYRDLNDQYLTTVSPLSHNLDRVYNFINDQSADGGGDYPEAVDAALEEALAQEWSEHATSRLLFLLLDAPPHETEDVLSTLKDQISEAAEKGIKIIPISASGINRETEFLLKYMSIATNGTYVFVTDDSGIGNPHLAPIVDGYEVEKLNDLLVRLISSYSESYDCQTSFAVQDRVKIYPNPTSNFVNIESEATYDQIRVVANSGKVVYQVKDHQGQTRLDLSFLASGVYAIQCLAKDRNYQQNIIVVNG